MAINVKTGMPPFGILANHKIKMCHNSTKKYNDTKDYSEQLEFLNSQPYYASKKMLTSRQIFRYAVPACTVTKKALGLRYPVTSSTKSVCWVYEDVFEALALVAK